MSASAIRRSTDTGPPPCAAVVELAAGAGAQLVLDDLRGRGLGQRVEAMQVAWNGEGGQADITPCPELLGADARARDAPLDRVLAPRHVRVHGHDRVLLDALVVADHGLD